MPAFSRFLDKLELNAIILKTTVKVECIWYVNIIFLTLEPMLHKSYRCKADSVKM